MYVGLVPFLTAVYIRGLGTILTAVYICGLGTILNSCLYKWA